MIDWLIGGRVGWSIEWLIDWLIDWFYLIWLNYRFRPLSVIVIAKKYSSDNVYD